MRQNSKNTQLSSLSINAWSVMPFSYTPLPTATPLLGLPEAERPTKRSPRRKTLSIFVGILLLLAVGIGAFYVDAEELLRAFGRQKSLESLNLEGGNQGTSVGAVVERPAVIPAPRLSCPDTWEAARVIRESREVENWMVTREFFLSTPIAC